MRNLLSDGLCSQGRRKEEGRACRIETVRAISMLFTSPAALAGRWDRGYGEGGCIPFTVGEFDVIVGWVIHMESRIGEPNTTSSWPFRFLHLYSGRRSPRQSRKGEPEIDANWVEEAARLEGTSFEQAMERQRGFRYLY